MDQVHQEDNHQVVMLFDVGRGEGGGGRGEGGGGRGRGRGTPATGGSMGGRESFSILLTSPERVSLTGVGFICASDTSD